MIEKQLNNFELYEIDGTLYSLEELKGFIESNEFLQKENLRLLREHRDLSDTTNFQKRQINALKFRGINLITEGFGAVGHPSAQTHLRMGLELAERIRAFMREPTK